MDPIKGMNQITRLLRQKLSERSSALSGTGTAESHAALQSGPATRIGIDEIKRKIGVRIKALSEDDRKGPKAVQIFVELVITWEFGDQLLQDPQFTNLSREIVQAMSENPDVWKKMQALLNQIA
jgi:hypothetical protein